MQAKRIREAEVLHKKEEQDRVERLIAQREQADQMKVSHGLVLTPDDSLIVAD